MPATNTPESGPVMELVILRMTWKMLPKLPIRSPKATATTPVKEAAVEERTCIVSMVSVQRCASQILIYVNGVYKLDSSYVNQKQGKEIINE